MFNEPDTTAPGGEEWNKKLLLRLEQVAHVTTTAAFCLTVVLVTTGLAAELNPVADSLFGSLGWAATGVVAIVAMTAAFASCERYLETAPRAILAGGASLAIVGILDLGVNLWLLSRTGLPEFVNWGAYGPALAVVLIAGIVAIGRRSIRPIVVGQLRQPHPKARAVALALLVVASIVILPFMGGLSLDRENDGIASAEPQGFSQVGSHTGHTNWVEAVAGGDGFTYSGARDGEVHKLDQSDMSQSGTYTGHGTAAIYALEVGPNGYVYSGADDNSIHKIDPSDMSQVDTYTGHSDNIEAIVEGPDGYLYTGSRDNTVHKIDPTDMTQVDSYTGHSGRVYALAMGSDGYLYSGGGDSQAHRINISDMSNEGTFTGHSNYVSGISHGPDGYVYTASGDGDMHKVNPSDMSLVDTYSGISGDSVLAGGDGYVYIDVGSDIERIDPSDMTLLDSYTGHSGGVNSITVAPDGYLYSGARDDEVHKVDTNSTMNPEPVSGTVTDSETGDPLKGVWVGADHPDVDSTTTDSNGEYELSVPDPGTYDVTADDGEYVSTKTVDVPDGGLTGVDFQLGPADPAGQSVGLVEDELGMFPADDTQVGVYERSTEYKSVEDGMSVDTWHEETWTKTETASFNWENRTRVDLVDGRYYRLELEGPHGNWEDSGFLYNETEMSDSAIWLEPETDHLDTNGDGTAGGSSSSGTNGAGSSTPTPTAYEDGTYPTATEQEGFGPTALGKCQTLDGQDGVEVEYWDPNYETAELEANLTTDDSTTYYIHKYFDDPRGYYRGCIADSMTDNASAEADVGLNHTALDGEGEVLTSGRQSFSAPTFGPSGKAPASTGERLGLLAGVLGALGALWFGGNRVVPASSVRSWPSETINPAFGVGAPIVTVLGLDLAGGGVISAGVATGLAQIAPFAGIVGVTVGGYYALRWIRAPPAS